MHPTVGVAQERYTCLTEVREGAVAAHSSCPQRQLLKATCDLRATHTQPFGPAFLFPLSLYSFAFFFFRLTALEAPDTKGLPLARSTKNYQSNLWGQKKGLTFNWGSVVLSYCIARGR